MKENAKMKCEICNKEINFFSDECAFCPSYLPGHCDGRIDSGFCNDCCRNGPGPILIFDWNIIN